MVGARSTERPAPKRCNEVPTMARPRSVPRLAFFSSKTRSPRARSFFARALWFFEFICDDYCDVVGQKSGGQDPVHAFQAALELLDAVGDFSAVVAGELHHEQRPGTALDGPHRLAQRQVAGGQLEQEVVHHLGNLVLAPAAANTSLSSRPWTEKKVLYAALGATTAEEAKAILNGSGLTFAQSTEELASMSSYLPHLRALGQREAEWDPKFRDQRAEVLLRLAYARLKDWLGLELSESSTDLVAHVDEETDLEDDFGADDSPERQDDQ